MLNEKDIGWLGLLLLLAMEPIKEFIAAGDYAGLIAHCEDMEFNLALASNIAISPEDLYAPCLVGYLLLNELPGARFLWKRIPDRVKSQSEELRAVWSVGTALWQRDFPNVYRLIETREWKPLIAPLIAKLADNVRERVLVLMSDAYSSISVEVAVKNLGMPQDQLMPILVRRGWTHDPSTDNFQPTKLVSEVQSSSLTNFGQLTQLVVQLEKS